jgi:hypothetical protein
VCECREGRVDDATWWRRVNALNAAGQHGNVAMSTCLQFWSSLSVGTT